MSTGASRGRVQGQAERPASRGGRSRQRITVSMIAAGSFGPSGGVPWRATTSGGGGFRGPLASEA